MLKTKGKDLEYYKNLPYTITIERRDDQGTYYVARVKELTYLTMTGDTPEEALKELEIEFPEWIQTSLELGHTIPEPQPESKASGKLVLRVPASLHEILIKTARQEGVSLNQYMVAALARAVGRDEAIYAKEKKTTYQTVQKKQTAAKSKTKKNEP